jgi:hypothetical protein
MPYVGRPAPMNQAERTARPASRGRRTKMNVHVHFAGLPTIVDGRGEKVKKIAKTWQEAHQRCNVSVGERPGEVMQGH